MSRSPVRVNVTGDATPYLAALAAATRSTPMSTPPLTPWRRTLRTVFQALVALAVMVPVLVAQTGLNTDQIPWLAGVLAVCAAVTRIMAIPAVEDFLQKVLPWLAARPSPKQRNSRGAASLVTILAVVVLVLLLLWLIGVLR